MAKPIYIRVITGFRKNQGFTINAEEAHKAYHLFLNPDKRGIFSNGVAVQGRDIRQIVPDYNATMGWNETYELNEFDWQEVNSKGIDRKARAALRKAKLIAEREEYLSLPLRQAIEKSGLELDSGKHFSGWLSDRVE